jgi:hypothetical protein
MEEDNEKGEALKEDAKMPQGGMPNGMGRKEGEMDKGTFIPTAASVSIVEGQGE